MPRKSANAAQNTGRYTKVARRQWATAWFLGLSRPQANAQSLFLFLTTGLHLTLLPGLFCAGQAGLAEALGWTLEEFRTCWAELEAAGVARADWTARLVYLPGEWEANAPPNPQALLSWRHPWDELPDCPLKGEVWQAWREQLTSKGEAWGVAFAKACARPGAPLREIAGGLVAPPAPKSKAGGKNTKTSLSLPGINPPVEPPTAGVHAPPVAPLAGEHLGGEMGRHPFPDVAPDTAPCPGTDPVPDLPPSLPATSAPPAPEASAAAPCALEEPQESPEETAPTTGGVYAGVHAPPVAPHKTPQDQEQDQEQDLKREREAPAPVTPSEQPRTPSPEPPDDAPEIHRVEGVSDLKAMMAAQGVTIPTTPPPRPAPRPVRVPASPAPPIAAPTCPAPTATAGPAPAANDSTNLPGRLSKVGPSQAPNPLDAMGPEAKALLSELKRHEGTRHLATVALAEALAAGVVTGSVSLEGAKRAIGECALKHGGEDLPSATMAQRIKAFVAFAGRKEHDRAAAQGAAPQARPNYQTDEQIREQLWRESPEGKAAAKANHNELMGRLTSKGAKVPA